MRASGVMEAVVVVGVVVVTMAGVVGMMMIG